MRRLLRGCLLVLLLLLLGTLGLIGALLGRLCGIDPGRLAAAGARGLTTLLTPLLGLRLTLHRTHPTPQAAVYIANHQSSLDLLLIGSFAPKQMRFTAKATLGWLPLWGPLLHLIGTFFIDRQQKKQTLKRLLALEAQLRQAPESILFFPEGHRTHQPSPVPFKKGAFHLALASALPIVIVAISDQRRVDYTKKVSGHLQVEISAPIPTQGRTASALQTDCAALMTKMLQRLNHTAEKDADAPAT